MKGRLSRVLGWNREELDFSRTKYWEVEKMPLHRLWPSLLLPLASMSDILTGPLYVSSNATFSLALFDPLG